MKRSFIESRLKSLPQALEDKIKQAPVQFFVVALVVGFICAFFFKLLATLLVLGAVVVGVLWYFGEEGADATIVQDGATDKPRDVNGHGTGRSPTSSDSLDQIR